MAGEAIFSYEVCVCHAGVSGSVEDDRGSIAYLDKNPYINRHIQLFYLKTKFMREFGLI